MGAVAQAAVAHAPVIVVDDGSTEKLPGCQVAKLFVWKQNGGKATALRAGFVRAMELGFTHAITMDADGQHFAEDLPKFLQRSSAAAGILSRGRAQLGGGGLPETSPAVESYFHLWYRIETGVRLRDTQCGFRCYPLALVQQLKIRSDRYAYELEFMVRAAWVGTSIVAVPVKCTYEPGKTGTSHFRTVRDFVHITNRNIILVLQSWFVPLSLRMDWSFGRKDKFWHIVHEFSPTTPMSRASWRVRSAWVCSSALRRSGDSIGRLAVGRASVAVEQSRRRRREQHFHSAGDAFYFCATLTLGSWLLTGKWFEFSLKSMTRAEWWAAAKAHAWEWVVGSPGAGDRRFRGGDDFNLRHCARMVRKK